MPELKTHLLFEALDIAFDKTRRRVAASPAKEFSFWNFFHPEDVCALAISSSHGYRMIAYILKHFATAIFENPDIFLCLAVVINRVYQQIKVLRFSSKYHIQALMNIAGRFCTTIQRGDLAVICRFTHPFYDGLAFNEVVSITSVCRDRKLFRAYLKGRQFIQLDNFHLSCDYRHSNCLYDAGDVIISLTVRVTDPNEAGTFACFKGLKIQDLTVHAYDTTITRNIFLNATPQIQYMKRLSVYSKLSIRTANEMLLTYDIDCVIMNRVRLVNSRIPFDDLVDQWRGWLQTLYSVIFSRKSTNIVVRCIGSNTFKKVPLTTMVKKLNEAFPDYEVECTNYIQCRYSKVVGGKSLEVKFEFHTPR